MILLSCAGEKKLKNQGKKKQQTVVNHRSSSNPFPTSGNLLSAMSEPNPNPCIHLVEFRPPLSPTAASDCLPCCLCSTSSLRRIRVVEEPFSLCLPRRSITAILQHQYLSLELSCQ